MTTYVYDIYDITCIVMTIMRQCDYNYMYLSRRRLELIANITFGETFFITVADYKRFCFFIDNCVVYCSSSFQLT